MRIYQKRSYLITTLFIVILPFALLLIFAKSAELSVTSLALNVFISVARLFIAYIIAVALAWALAVIFRRGRAGAIALPVFDVLQSFPTFAILPIVAYFFGPSDLVIIFFLVITVIWPILFSILSSLKAIKHEWEEAAQIYQLHGWQMITKFVLPASIPGLITGSVIGLGEGWEAMVGTEIIVGIKSGVGNFFQIFSQNPTITALGVAGLLALIFSINKLLWLPLLEWSHHSTEE